MDRWWRFARVHGLDFLVMVAALESAIGTALRTDAEAPHGVRLWLEMLVIAGLVLTLLGRERFPFAVPAMFWIGAAAASFLDGRLIASQAGIFVAGLFGAVLLGSVRNGVESRAGAVIVLAASAVVVYNVPTSKPADLLFTPLIFGVGWVAGFALRERNLQAEMAVERAERAERARETAAQLAVAEERARMARELHDVVAHAVSVMVLQVGAVRHRMEPSAEREALGNVEQAGRKALAEMRRLLGALRGEDDALELAPQPGLNDLETLAGDVRASGLDVRLHVAGAPVALPAALDLSAYRIVQEGLTNSLRHARATHADVTVDYASDRVCIEVRDDGNGGSVRSDAPVNGQGHGLIGIGERVKLYGGDMSTYTSSSGGFVLRASLPMDGDDV
ncbi:MAG TPA: sensor histidine kinase [Solirubrobacteraceae bacterium]|nr:sensor histidine kinase [Solirubrobacteraceae bacterium]